MQLNPHLGKVNDESHSLVEQPEPAYISECDRREISISNTLAERLVLGAFIDGVAAGVLTVVVDRDKVEIMVVAVVSTRVFLLPNRGPAS